MISRISLISGKPRAGAPAIALLVGVVAAGVVTAPPAEAAFPGRNGKIAYDVVAGTASHIWTVNPDGSGKRQLTVDGRNKSPRWSADGRRIAFTRNKNVYVMNADGSGKRQVTSLRRDLQPAWSPDGRQLVFIRLAGNGRGDLFRIPSTGGAATRLTNDAASSGGNDRPTWSPTGGTILFLHYRQPNLVGALIKTVSVTTGRQRTVPAGVPNDPSDRVASPDYTADGQNILFLGFCAAAGDCGVASLNVMRANLSSPARTQVTFEYGIEDSGTVEDVAAAPDGDFVRVGCESFNLDLDPPDYDFCGIRPGHVAGAANPDWQPVR